MGYIKHHAILVTGFHPQSMKDLHGIAVEMFGSLVSEIIDSKMNGYLSFFVAPDGSKEGWEESDKNDLLRREFTDLLHLSRYIDYCEVIYGDEAGDSRVVCFN